MKTAKTIILLSFLHTSLYAQCTVDNATIISILSNEAHNKRIIGYEYLISFNKKRDAKRVKYQFQDYFIDSRTIDCKDKKRCVEILKYLENKGIKNLDLGAFQLNRRYHKHDYELYFNLLKSYKVACNYINKLIKKSGYTWRAIANYHSHTPEYNKKYRRRLEKSYQEIKQIINN